MAPRDKKMASRITIRPLTTLQKVMISAEFDIFIILIILINCVFMASESPVDSVVAKYIVVSNYIFNIIFILELSLQIAAFGVLPYFSDYWHYLDALVVATSLLDIVLAILNLLSGLIKGANLNFNVKVLRILRVIRFFRVLRPLKALRYFKGILIFIESLAMSVDILAITTGMFLTAMIAIAFLTNSFIGDLLLNRCLPDKVMINGNYDLALNSTARADPNYKAYGVDYFYSAYNLDYCKDSGSCPSGVPCRALNLDGFLGVPGDYSTPYNAFKTNLSFVTLRGWPLIFTAISQGYSTVYAFLVLFATVLICPLFILNMFPAIFIISLKRCEDSQKRLDWLAYYPGDKETVTELELFIWANNNQELFFRLENAPSVNIITQLINGIFRCFVAVGLFSKPVEVAKVPAAGDKMLTDGPDEDDDELFLGAEEDDPDFGKGKLCVPKCRSVAALRSIFTADTSPFSHLINVIIVLNILSLAADAASTPPVGRRVVLYLNFAFITIFMAEVIVKILLLGPCLYLDNPFNLMDFTLVVLSIPTFFDSSFQVLAALRILRLARLARTSQITRLYNQLNAEGAQKAPKTSIDLGRLSAMIFDLTTPMINNIILVMVLMYMYSLIGMQFFASPAAAQYALPPFSLKLRHPLEIQTNATAVEIAGIFSAGEYLPRMNFNCFGNAFVTVFNLGVLNGWYLFMINTIRISRFEGALWYFFSYVYLVVFLLGSTLIASVASVLDRHAKAMIRDIASANKSVVDRYVQLSRRERLRESFKRLKKNTIERDESTNPRAGNKQKLKREAVIDWLEAAPAETFLVRIRRERADYSFFLFSRSNPIRRVVKWLIEGILFQLVITFAVLISVIGVVSNEQDLMGPVNTPLFIVVVFLAEMGLLWLAYGLVGAPDAYFNQPLYLVDFFVNIAMMYAYYSPKVDVLNQLRLFRLLKVPNLMLYLTDSNTLRLFFVMLFEAIPSLGSVLSMALGTTFLAAVVGVQLYTGAFNHCSYPDYPGGRSRYAVDTTHFPTGCSGIGYDDSNVTRSHATFNTVTGYGSGTILYDLHWQPRLDNFDSIFTACKSTLRVIMSNEWQGILFNSLDIVGVDYQPKINFRRGSGGGSFIFFFILSLLGITIGALYVSIFYYHFVITCILTGRKSMIGRQDAMWAMYEEKLILVKQAMPMAGSSRAFLANFYRKLSVKIVITAYCVLPIILLIGFYGSSSYTDHDFMLYDTIFSILYVVEYSVRGMSDLTFKKGLIGIYKGTNRQEAGIVIFLIICILLNVRALSGGHQVIINHGKSRDIEFVCACGIMRVYRLAILFPNALRVLGVMQTSLGGFISLCVYCLIVVMIFGLLGRDVMFNLKPSYGSPFLDGTLNFQSLVNSWVTLLAIGTGNYYSEVLDNLKQETNGNYGLQIFMEIYFLAFYLLFFLTLKSFAIQIIIRYESTFGSSLGIAGEQVSSFQHSWRKAGLFDKVKYDKLAGLLGKHLPPPLGLAGTNVKYLELSRFIKKVLLCMPADAKRCDDMDNSGKFTRMLYPPELMPSDIRNINERWDPTKHRYSFRQVIVAVHKRALFDMVLADEAATNAARLIHQSRLDNIVVYLSRLTLARYDTSVLPFKAMMLMQRLRPDKYRTYFSSIMRAQLHTLRLKIHVFGFSSFDAFIVSTLRAAVHLELRAAGLQLEVKKRLEVAAHHSRLSKQALDKAKKYLTVTKSLGKVVDELYDSKMKTVWDISSIDVFASGREKRAVSAVAIDYSGKVFVALNSGLLKIYKTRELPGLPMRLVQKIIMKAHIRSLVVSQDAKKVFVGCGNNVIVLALANSKTRLNYKELLSFSAHTAAVNCVLPFDRFIISGGQDSVVYLWRLNSKDPANSYDAGSAVFCMCVMPVCERNVAVDEMTLTDILICGTQRGRLLVLPLPLVASSTESATWEGFTVDGGLCGVSAVQVAWGYCYAGFTDGRVKTWAVEMSKSSSPTANPIKMVAFFPVQSVQVHAGPVTCLAFTGGSLFSASYDFSILPWTAPDRMNAKTPANFTQSYKEGLIYHSNSILTVASNKSMMVTGDEGGRVVVIYSKRVQEDFMASGSDSGSNIKSKPLFNFSFIEYDFKKCFVDNNGGVIEEEAMLSVANLSGKVATIRCLLKRHPCFRVETCENENRNSGCEVVSLTSQGTSQSKIATRFDNNHTVQFRIVFHPVETRVVHLPVQFLINEKDMVTIQLRGSGCKSKIYMVQNVKMYEMGTVPIGSMGVEIVEIENKEERPILVNCLSECEDKIENSNYEIVTVKHNLVEHFMTVIPRCFLIPPREKVKILVQFKPPTKIDVFKMPIRAIYGGGEGTLAEVRVRSADPPSSVTRDTMAAPPIKSEIVQSAILIKNKKFGDALDGSIAGESEVTEEDVESHLGMFDEMKAMQYLYRGLRDLTPSETPCPSDLLVGLLQDIGWRLAVEGPLAMLMHPETGIFIEIPNCHSTSSTSTGKPEPLPTLSEFEITYRCDKLSSYEIWHGDRLIKSGAGEPNVLNTVLIDSAELYHVTDRFGSAIPTSIASNKDASDNDTNAKRFQSATAGTQMLVLMVYVRDSMEKAVEKAAGLKIDRKPLFTNNGTQADGRVLLQVTHMKIFKGFRLGFLQSEEDDSDDDHGTLQLEERVLIGGITRVITYLDQDLGTLTEFFEKDPEAVLSQTSKLHRQPASLGGEPYEDLFARCVLNVNTAAVTSPPDFIPDKNKSNTAPRGVADASSSQDEGPTHVRVVDRAVALELEDPLESTVAEHKTDDTQQGQTTSGIKEIHIDKPVLTGDINVHRCSRELHIQLLKKPIQEGLDDMVRDEVMAETEVSAHSAMHLRSENQVYPFGVTRSTLPHLVHSHKHGVYMRVSCPIEEPPARMKHLYALLNQVVLDEGTSELRISSIYLGQWYFIVDRNSLKLVSSAMMDPVETVDLTFLTRGFVAEFKGPGERCMAAMDGRHVTSSDVEELPKSMKAALSKLQLANNRGTSSQFTDAPLFLTGKWGELVRHSLHRKVVNAMLCVVERARVVTAGRAAHEAAAITKEYEAFAAAANAGVVSTGARKGIDMHKKKEAELRVKRIVDSTPPTIDLTFRDVYSDMTRLTNEMAAADAAEEKKDSAAKSDAQRLYGISAVMSTKNLTSYLLRETLPGFDEPLSIIQVGAVLETLERNPANHAVKVEQFALWYKLDDEKQLRAELKPKRVFACLLEEVTQTEELISTHDPEDKVVRGASARKIIKDMHLGMDESRKWDDQESELQSSSAFNEGMDFYPATNKSEKESRMSITPSVATGLSSYFKPKLPKLNPRERLSSLTGFIRNISNRRAAKTKTNETEESKMSDMELVASVRAAAIGQQAHTEADDANLKKSVLAELTSRENDDGEGADERSYATGETPYQGENRETSSDGWDEASHEDSDYSSGSGSDESSIDDSDEDSEGGPMVRGDDQASDDGWDVDEDNDESSVDVVKKSGDSGRSSGEDGDADGDVELEVVPAVPGRRPTFSL